MAMLKKWLGIIGSFLAVILTLGGYALYQRKKREDSDIAAKRAMMEAEQCEVTNEVLQDMRNIDILYAADSRQRLLAKARYNQALASTIDSGSAASLRAARLAAGLPVR
jgi:hypothetical protein